MDASSSSSFVVLFYEFDSNKRKIASSSDLFLLDGYKAKAFTPKTSRSFSKVSVYGRKKEDLNGVAYMYKNKILGMAGESIL